MTPAARFLTAVARLLIRATCSIESDEMRKLPDKGPLLVVFNHINFLDAPVLRLQAMPREVYALTKKETWDNPIFRILADNWGGVPLDRENPAVSTLREAERLMKEEKILYIAPEGTRSSSGILQEANVGIASIAIRTGCPIVPLAHWGAEHFWSNLKRLKRTRMVIRVGDPFRVKPGIRASKRSRRAVTEQIMAEMVKLLPSEYHGVYAGIDDPEELLLEPVTLS